MEVLLWGDVELIDPQNIGPQEVRVYTRGQCGALALAIHEATGWQLCVMADSDLPEEVHDYGDHVICITPDGMGVDVTGFHSLDAMQDRWGLSCFVEVDADAVWNIGWDEHDMEPAREVAKTILAKAPAGIIAA